MVQLLGRSEQISDYVRRGCSEGFTEIHLSGGERGGSIVVVRRIKSDGNSQWRLNGAPDAHRSALLCAMERTTTCTPVRLCSTLADRAAQGKTAP